MFPPKWDDIKGRLSIKEFRVRRHLRWLMSTPTSFLDFVDSTLASAANPYCAPGTVDRAWEEVLG